MTYDIMTDGYSLSLTKITRRYSGTFPIDTVTLVFILLTFCSICTVLCVALYKRKVWIQLKLPLSLLYILVITLLKPLGTNLYFHF